MDQSCNNLFNALKELGVDVDKTISRFMDNSEIYFTFLKRFPDEDRIAPIRKALSEKNTEEVVRTAHKLKGVTANLGMTELSAAADEIVKKGRSGVLDGAEEDLERVVKLNEAIFKAIRENI